MYLHGYDYRCPSMGMIYPDTANIHAVFRLNFQRLIRGFRTKVVQ